MVHAVACVPFVQDVQEPRPLLVLLLFVCTAIELPDIGFFKINLIQDIETNNKHDCPELLITNCTRQKCFYN